MSSEPCVDLLVVIEQIDGDVSRINDVCKDIAKEYSEKQRDGFNLITINGISYNMILGEDTSEYFDSQYNFARNELVLFKPNVYFGYSELIDLSELDKLRNQMSNSLQNIKEKYNCNIRFLLSLDYN